MPAPNNPSSGLTSTSAFRTYALVAGLIALIAAIVVGILVWQTNALLSRMTLAAVANEAEAIARLAVAAGTKRAGEVVDERGRDDQLGLYLLLDADGRKIAGNLNRWPPELAEDKAGGLFHYERAQAGSGERHLAFGVPSAIAGGGHLLVARDLETQRGFILQVRNLLLLAVGAIATTALVGGLLTSRAVLARIGAMTRTSETIMAGRLSERIALTGQGDELDQLAVSLNTMLERIERLMGGLREVSDNIAHDLKTPLTRLRNRAEAALRDPSGAEGHRAGLEHAIEEADELIKTFNAMLLIARLEAGSVDASGETFDLGQIVADVVELYEPLAEQQGRRIDAEIADAIAVRANRRLVGQAVANLIENALNYGRPITGAASAIVVAVRRGAQGSAEIAVGDHGRGIAPEDRERALERFVRLEASRTQPGSGIGLSLVAAVARLHGGSVRLEDNTPGLRVVVSLPKQRISGAAANQIGTEQNDRGAALPPPAGTSRAGAKCR